MTRRQDVHLVNSRRFMRRIFRGLVRENYPRGTELVTIKTKEVGRFRFKHALRYHLRLRTPRGKVVDVIIRGNVPSQDTGHEIVVADRVQRALSRRGFSFGQFRAPVSFGVIPKLRLNLYEEFPGTTLESLVRRRDAGSLPIARRAGMWLSAFHRLRLTVGRRRTERRVRDELGFFRDDISRYGPTIVGRAIRVLDSVRRAQQEIFRTPRPSFRTIHGDLNLGNIIAAPNHRVAYIDYGGSWVFDPLSDPGNFLAQVDLLVWRGFASRRLAARLTASFLRGYRQHPPDRGLYIKRRVDLHRAWWTLQILAYTLSTKPALGQRIARPALAAAELLLRQHGYHPVPALERTPHQNFRTALRNPVVMRAYFAEHLRAFFPWAQKIDGLDVEHPRALSGSSFLMRYNLRLRLPNGGIEDRVIRGNNLDPGAFAILRRVHRSRSREFRTMRPLRYESRFRYVFYEELAGLSLRAVDPRTKKFSRLLPEIAGALAAFHRTPGRGLRELSWPNEVAFRAELLRHVRSSPEGQRLLEAQSLNRITGGIERRLWKRFRGLVHNDFQASNLIVSRRGIGIIDFTQSGLGNRALDVANFLTHLRVMLDRVVSERRIEANADRFLTSYERRLSARERWSLRAALPHFQLRSALDVFATTVRNLGSRDPNRRRYTRLLHNLMNELVKKFQNA